MTQFSKIWLSIDKLATSWRRKKHSANRESLKPVFKQHDRSLNQYTFPSCLGIPIHFFPSAYFIFFPTGVIPRWLVTLLSFFTGPGFAKLSYKFAIFGGLLNRQHSSSHNNTIFSHIVYLCRNISKNTHIIRLIFLMLKIVTLYHLYSLRGVVMLTFIHGIYPCRSHLS